MRLRRVMREPEPMTRLPRTPPSIRSMTIRLQVEKDLAHHLIRRAAALPFAVGGRGAALIEALKDALTFFDLPDDTAEALRAEAKLLGLIERDYMRRLLSERSLRLLAGEDVEPLRPVPPVSKPERDTPDVMRLVEKLEDDKPTRIRAEVPNALLPGLHEKAVEFGGVSIAVALVAVAEDHRTWLALDPLQAETLGKEAATLELNARDYMRAVFAQEGLRLRLAELERGASEPAAKTKKGSSK